MILIVSSYIDPHVEVVGAELNLLGFEYTRIDLGAFFHDFDISYVLSGKNVEFSIRNRHTQKTFSNCEITGVWWRRVGSVRDDLGRPTEHNADVIETTNFIKNLVDSAPCKYFPLGHPRDIRRAENKLIQLNIATKIGFDIPSICFSNSLSLLDLHVRPDEEYVIKSLSLHSAVRNGEELSFYAVGMPGNELKNKFKINDHGACLIQNRIHRKYDVRLNVLPSTTIGVKINLDTLPVGEVDWRPTTMNHFHEIIDAPVALEHKCRLMLAELGVPWGAFDFIVDEAGKWWFLECNPNGQWLWIQQKTDVNIARHFANEIAAHQTKQYQD